MLGRMPVNHRPGNFGSASPGTGLNSPVIAIERDLLDGDAKPDRQTMRLAELVQMADDGVFVGKSGCACGIVDARRCREITIRVEMQPFVPPIPEFGKPAFLFQDKYRYAGLYQRMGGGQPRCAGADHDAP